MPITSSQVALRTREAPLANTGPQKALVPARCLISSSATFTRNQMERSPVERIVDAEHQHDSQSALSPSGRHGRIESSKPNTWWPARSATCLNSRAPLHAWIKTILLQLLSLLSLFTISSVSQGFTGTDGLTEVKLQTRRRAKHPPDPFRMAGRMDLT